MPRIKKRVFILSAVVVLVLGAWLAQLYFVADHAGVILFQKGDEAYLFMGAGHTGWHFPALSFPLVKARQYFNIPPDVSDQIGLSLVIRVTPEGVQRWMNKSADVALLTPFNDGFYARCPGTVLCKWTDKGFVGASPEEEKRIGIDNLYAGSLVDTAVNGWTTHQLKVAPGDHFEISLSRDVVIAVQNHSEYSGYPNVTVVLLRAGRAPETLYGANTVPRLVSRSEYERAFGKR